MDDKPEMTRNQPTPEGRELGAHVARLCEVAIADIKKNAPDITLPERCASCAFRAGTFPNGCPETVLDAIDCISSCTPFLCHHQKKGEPKHDCAGWLASMLSTKVQNVIRKHPLQPEGFVAPHRMLAHPKAPTNGRSD